jgi:hypothetical protein
MSSAPSGGDSPGRSPCGRRSAARMPWLTGARRRW